MNQISLLKIVSDLLQDKPSAEAIGCARKIIEGMINEQESKPKGKMSIYEENEDNPSYLSDEAETARKELIQ